MKDIKGEVAISLEELEVIRLCDLEGKNQSETGEEMNISQSTVFRHRKSAHHKIAEALIHGFAIRIANPADFFHCEDCGYTWPVPENLGVKITCEQCNSTKIHLHSHSENGKEIIS